MHLYTQASAQQNAKVLFIISMQCMLFCICNTAFANIYIAKINLKIKLSLQFEWINYTNNQYEVLMLEIT